MFVCLCVFVCVSVPVCVCVMYTMLTPLNSCVVRLCVQARASSAIGALQTKKERLMEQLREVRHTVSSHLRNPSCLLNSAWSSLLLLLVVGGVPGRL